MNDKINLKRQRRFYFSLILFTGIVLAIVLNIKSCIGFIRWILDVFRPLIIGFCIAFVMNVLMVWLSKHIFTKKWIKKKGLRTGLSLVFSMLIVLVVFVAILWIAIPQLIQSFRLLADRIPLAIHSFTNFLRSLTTQYPELGRVATSIDDNSRQFISDAMDYFRNKLPETLSQTVTIASTTIGAFASFFIGLLFSFYVLAYKSKLERQCRQILYSYLPEKRANKILYICHLTAKNFHAFIYGQCVEAVILAAMYTVCALIFKLPYTIMIATIFAVFSLIPLFGAWIGWGIGVFLIATVNPLQAITFTIIFAVVSQVEGNFIYPRIVGNSIGLPGIWVLAAVTVGGNMLGIIGMITAVPIVALFYTLLSESSQKRLRNHPDKVEEIIHKPSWNDYNPETCQFYDHPVHLVNVFSEPGANHGEIEDEESVEEVKITEKIKEHK